MALSKPSAPRLARCANTERGIFIQDQTYPLQFLLESLPEKAQLLLEVLRDSMR